LLELKKINDPYFRFNDTEYRWIALDNWTYTTTLKIEKHSPFLGTCLLVFHGLDTACSIRLNNTLIGNANNHFRRFVFCVNLKSGENTLMIEFQNPSNYALTEKMKYPYVVPDGFAPEQFGEENRNFIRKEQWYFYIG
jgi:beta-mannosidase